MGRLFNLKEWLSLADAAKHLSIVFGEDVTEADVLQLALDRRLRLSIYFNSGAITCLCVRTPTTIDEWEHLSQARPDIYTWISEEVKERADQFIESLSHAHDVDQENLKTVTNLQKTALVGHLSTHVRNIDDTLSVIVLDEDEFPSDVVVFNGLVDLHMTAPAVQGEITRLFQQNKFKVPIEQGHIDPGGVIFLYDDKGIYALTTETNDQSISSVLAQGFPSDSVVVVRASALREFEQSFSCSQAPTEEPNNAVDGTADYISAKLAILNQASSRFWKNAAIDDRGTHPDNAMVTEWLKQKGFSATLADKAASIIRPEWAAVGRKPEK